MHIYALEETHTLLSALNIGYKVYESYKEILYTFAFNKNQSHDFITKDILISSRI